MIHHLKIAAEFFEATPEPIPPSKLMFYDDRLRNAAKAFISSLDKYFADLATKPLSPGPDKGRGG